MIYDLQWSENMVYSNANEGKWVTVPAGIGFPPVFYLQSSSAGADIQTYVQAQQYNSGYTWVYEDSDTPTDAAVEEDDDDNFNMYLVVILGLVGVLVVGGVLMGGLKVLRDRPHIQESTQEPFLREDDFDNSFVISA